VLDTDSPSGHRGVDGEAALRDLEARHGTLPETRTARTPTGGFHRYFRHPGAGIVIKSSASRLGVGIDTIGDNAMVPVPPSIRPGVGAYTWTNELPVAEASAWLLELVMKPDPGIADTEGQELRADISRVAAALDRIDNPDLPWVEWNRIGMAAWRATDGSTEGLAAFETWSAKSTKHNPATTRQRWAHFASSPPRLIGAGTLFYLANGGTRYEEPQAEEQPQTNGAGGEQTSSEAPKSEPPKLPFIDMSRWDAEDPPPREWSVPERFPLYQTTLFSGECAVGKSIMQLHLSFAHALGREWLDVYPTPGPALFIDAEDDVNELHRRAARIAAYYGATFAEAIRGGLHLISLTGQDAVLASVVGRTNKIEPTPLYKLLLEAAGDLKPKMIGIASSANVFAGNESDRAQVQQFVSLLTRIALAAGGTVQLISHPSLTGINTDTGLSGNTAWHNSVRARSYLKSVKPVEGEQPDTDLRELVFKKSNYGPISASIVLRYRDGLYLPVPGVNSLDQAAREAVACEVFLALLKRLRGENRFVGAQLGRNYAPAIFAAEEEAKRARLSNKVLEIAMRELFRVGKIINESCGKPSRPAYRLAIKE
jgi:RecA-family ATPase